MKLKIKVSADGDKTIPLGYSETLRISLTYKKPTLFRESRKGPHFVC